MSVEDTDFSPPATAVMFLFNNSSHRFRSGDFLSTGVKFRHAPEAFPYYRLFFSAWQAVPETGKARRFLFSHLPVGFGDFCILFFSSGIVSVFLQCCKIRHNPCYLGNLRDFRVLGTAMYLVHRCCDDEALDAVLGEDVVVAAAEGFFRMQRSGLLLQRRFS